MLERCRSGLAKWLSGDQRHRPSCIRLLLLLLLPLLVLLQSPEEIQRLPHDVCRG
jgi:hypothetical protein